MERVRIKKNDMVIAISGADAGKTGKVMQVLSSRGRVIVEGLRMVKKALRKTQDNPQGGIAEKESSLAVSKVMLYCPEDKKGVRVRCIKEGQKRVRKCRICGHAFDS